MAKPLLDKVLKTLEKSDAKYGALVERIMKGGRGTRLSPEEVRQRRRDRPDEIERGFRHEDSSPPFRRAG